MLQLGGLKTTLLEYFIEIVELPMNVSANSYRGMNALEVRLLEENLFHLVADLLDGGLRRAFQLADLLYQFLCVHRFKYYQT